MVSVFELCVHPASGTRRPQIPVNPGRQIGLTPLSEVKLLGLRSEIDIPRLAPFFSPHDDRDAAVINRSRLSLLAKSKNGTAVEGLSIHAQDDISHLNLVSDS